MDRRTILALLAALTGSAVLAGRAWYQRRAAGALAARAYATPLAPPDGGRKVFHLGHSLVGPDMPAMLAQLAPEGHVWASQLGSGTTLKAHWEPGVEILHYQPPAPETGFADARAAIGSGTFDAVVLTEMVEIRDAIRYHDSATYLSRWADLARGANPETEVFLYETWHYLDDSDGWLERIDGDLERYWEGRLLRADLVHTGGVRPLLMIPAGQAMARLVRAVEGRGGVDNLTDRTSLFRKNDDGSQDQIHPNDLGVYLVALVHYACLYRRSPVGLPHELLRGDGTPADAPGPDAARLMQEAAWTAVLAHPFSGVKA